MLIVRRFVSQASSSSLLDLLSQSHVWVSRHNILSSPIHQFLKKTKNQIDGPAVLRDTGIKITPRDKHLAAYCFKLASDGGDAIAKMKLAQLYAIEDEIVDEEVKPPQAHAGEEEKRAAVIKSIRSQQRANARRKQGITLIDRQRQKGNSVEGSSLGRTDKSDDTIADAGVKLESDEILHHDRAAALRLMSNAAESGLVEAKVALGNIILSGGKEVLTAKKVQRAVDLYKEAAAAMHQDALYNLGLLYYEGKPPHLEADKKQAITWLSSAADCGDASAQYFLGHMFHVGDEESEVSVDSARCLDYLKRSVDQGHSGACYYLAMLYLHGDETTGLAADDVVSDRYLAAAAEAGHDEAWYCKGTMAYEQQHFTEALKYFTTAGELGCAEGWLNVGVMLHGGTPRSAGSDPIPSDMNSSREAYEKALLLGSAEAARNLASMHAMGDGTPKSLDTAKYLLQFAKELEDK